MRMRYIICIILLVVAFMLFIVYSLAKQGEYWTQGKNSTNIIYEGDVNVGQNLTVSLEKMSYHISAKSDYAPKMTIFYNGTIKQTIPYRNPISMLFHVEIEGDYQFSFSKIMLEGGNISVLIEKQQVIWGGGD